ncbi:MAG: hypothetical protein WD051_11055 [Steroidobacteraceae bacterium]
MELFCFASNNLTNIWAGIGAGKWAVAETKPADTRARVTKSKRLKIGSLGLLYCKETHSFTTPFLVYSEPDPDQVVTDIWPERWRLPFRIHPLGSPQRQVRMDDAKARWPTLKKSQAPSVTAAMNITGTTVFVPREITPDDWAMILTDLASAF